MVEPATKQSRSIRAAKAAGHAVWSIVPGTDARKDRVATKAVDKRLREERIEKEMREKNQAPQKEVALGVDAKAAKGEHTTTLNNALVDAIIHGQARSPQKNNPEALMRLIVTRTAFINAVMYGSVLTPYEQDDENYRKTMRELESGRSGPRVELAKQLKEAADHPEHIIKKLSNEQLDILYSTLFANQGMWITAAELENMQEKNPDIRAPPWGLWEEGVPKPDNAFFSFLESTAIRKAPDRTGEFIGGALLHLATNATFGGMKGDTRRKLLDSDTANRYLGERANPAIEATVSDFRGRIMAIFTTPRSELEPESKMPGLGFPNDQMVEEARQEYGHFYGEYTKAKNEEEYKKAAHEAAETEKSGSAADFAQAKAELTAAERRHAEIRGELAGLEKKINATPPQIGMEEARPIFSELSRQMVEAEKDVREARAMVGAAQSDSTAKATAAQTAAREYSEARQKLERAQQAAVPSANTLNARARCEENVNELADHFRQELLGASDSGGDVNSVITKLEKRIVHPDVWKVARDERINELTALMAEVKKYYPKDTRTALTASSDRERKIRNLLASATEVLEAAAEGRVPGQQGTEAGADSKSMVKPIIPMAVVDRFKRIVASTDEDRFHRLSALFFEFGMPQMGAGFERLASEMEETRKDADMEREFEDRRSEFTKKLATFKEDIERSGLHPEIASRLMTVRDMIESCSHEEAPIKDKAKLIMDTYAYPVRKAAQESVRKFGERDFDNITGIPKSQWIIARMIFESQSKGIESETGLDSDSGSKKFMQKVLWYATSPREAWWGRIFKGVLWTKPWPLFFWKPPLTSSVKEDWESIRTPWEVKSVGKNWRGDIVDSALPKKVGGIFAGGIKAYVAGGLLAGVVAGPILGHRLDERHWYTQHHLYTPYTWPMGLKSDESVVRMFGDSYDLPQKLGKRGEGYYRKAFNLGMELPGETAEATKARLDWVREQPAVLEFLQQRSLTPNRDRPMRVVDSRELKVGNNRNPDLCSGGTVERQEQEKTASEKAAVEEKAPDYHWYRPGSWEHWYTPWKGQKNNAAQSETAKTATDDKATVAATTKTPEVSTPGPEKTPAAPTQEKAAETKTLSGTQTRNDMPPACATTFGWSADPKVGFKDIFQDGMRQTRIKKGANIKQEVPLVRVKPDGSYNAADLASYMPSDQNDGFTTANKFCCTLSVRYEELPDSRVFNSAPGSADRFLDTMEKDLFNKDGKGKLVRNDGRGRTFVDANGQVKPGYFDDQETIYGMVEAGHLVNLDQGRRMRDLGLNEIDNVNFVQSNIESRSMQRFVTMCTRADDKTYARKEGNGQKKPRDELLSAWRENVGAAKPGLDPVMVSVPEDVLGSALDKTLSEKRDLTEDVSKEYEQVKLRREFTSLALDQTALDILTADKDILGVVRSYETPAAEFRVVRPRASGFVYSLSKYKKDGGNVQDFSLSAPDEHGTRQGPKVAGARSKGYISRTGQVEDGAPAKSGVTAEAVDPAIAKFWETQVGFANMVHGVENGLHDAKGKAAKAEGRIFGDALETVYKRDWAAMRLGIETELYRVLSATDNGGSDPAAKAEKAAFDRRKTMQLNVSGKGADMQVTPAGKGAQKQLKAFIYGYVHEKLEASKPK